MVPELVTVGGLTVDHVISADGIVALNQAGGNGAYSAVGALQWVERVGLVSHAVATYPRPVLARLEAGGIDLSGVRWSETELTSGNWFIYDGEGRRDEGLASPPGALGEAGFPTDRLRPEEVAAWRAHLGKRRVPGEVSYSEFRVHHPLRADQVPDAWLGTRGVHLAPSQPEVMLAMLDRFGAGGAVITADSGWQLTSRPLDEIAPILGRVDAFVPSEVELAAHIPGAGLADALRVLAARCRGAVAVKLGPKGALVWDRAADAGIEVAALKVHAVDPTGAGDGFCGGFLAGLVETSDPVAAARYGAVSASRIVTRLGADGALPADRPASRAALETEFAAWC
jgi:ribokinase